MTDSEGTIIEGLPETHYWDCVLTDEEAKRLAAGADPSTIRPDKYRKNFFRKTTIEEINEARRINAKKENK